MLKYLIWFIIICLIAVGGMYLFSLADGHLILFLHSTSYTVSLRWLIAVAILLIALIYLLYLLISLVVEAIKKSRNFYRHRKEIHVTQDINAAIIAFFEGRYQRTLSLVEELLKNHALGKLGTAVLILGAESAHRLQQFDRRDEYLSNIYDKSQPDLLWTNLIWAEGALKENDYKKFLYYADQAARKDSKLTALARLRLAYGIQVEDPETLLSALEQLEKNHAISQVSYKKYLNLAYRLRLKGIANSEKLDAFIKSLPESVMQDKKMVVEISERYLSLQNDEALANWILQVYPKGKNSALLKLLVQSFPKLGEKQQKKTLRTLESWLKENSDDTDLLEVLGILTFNAQLWGKARFYLEKEVALSPRLNSLVLLSRLLYSAGEEDKAKEAAEAAFSLAECGGGEER